MEGVKTLEEMKEIVSRLKEESKKIVFTNGCYDIIHKGHVEILRKMSELGDVLIVGLNSDESVRKFKGFSRPINNELDRAFVVLGIKGVDYVVIFNEDNPLSLIRELKPDVHVKGGAGLLERVRDERELVEGYGGEMILLDLLEGYSSSEIIEEMKRLG